MPARRDRQDACYALPANDKGTSNKYNAFAAARVEDWGAYVSRVWVVASSRRRTFMGSSRRRDAFASTRDGRAPQRC